ncbi:hypothetical protein [Streptomyces sp. Tu 4128]|uniref:hypothetical protein n=1 Tax=Streptomyces sp. Tu 4128 TaxID=1120314 RepID=UPI001F11D4F5|nr:hypothetical protein [Streptomyces sp. Tu 4128]
MATFHVCSRPRAAAGGGGHELGQHDDGDDRHGLGPQVRGETGGDQLPGALHDDTERAAQAVDGDADEHRPPAAGAVGEISAEDSAAERAELADSDDQRHRGQGHAPLFAQRGCDEGEGVELHPLEEDHPGQREDQPAVEGTEREPVEPVPQGDGFAYAGHGEVTSWEQ